MIDGREVNNGILVDQPILEKLIDEKFFHSYCFTVVLQSISKNAFDYWNSIKNEFERTGDIFEAPPARIRGNVLNVESTKNDVIGLFSAIATDTMNLSVNSTDINTNLRQCRPFGTLSDACTNCLIIANSSLEKRHVMSKSMYRILLSCIVCMQCCLLFAQQQLKIQTDKNFYSSGEQMGLVISQSSTNSPEVIYVDLLDKQGVVLQQLTLKSTGIAATGSIAIPLDWASDWYLVRAYSVWLPSLSIKDLAYQYIPIYNEFDETPAQTYGAIEVNPTAVENNSLSIKTNKSIVHSGETLEFFIPTATNSSTYYTAKLIDQSTFELNQFFDAYRPAVKLGTIPAPEGEKTVSSKLLFLGKLDQELQNALGAMYVAEEAILVLYPLMKKIFLV